MEFHTFGNPHNRAIILIHGVLTPWQIWEEHIAFFKDQYYVIVPALDGHVEEYVSTFISIDDEAAKIEQFMQAQLDENARVHAVCGLSMGALIANRLFERNNISIQKLVLDGAPLMQISPLAKKFMTMSYKNIIHKSQKRNPKIMKKFCKEFLPETYLESYLKIADNMRDTSIENMIDSVCSTVPNPRKHIGTSKILFLHGTMGNEVYSMKSAALMQQHYPDMAVECFRGYKHAELCIYQSAKWLETVNAFLRIRY